MEGESKPSTFYGRSLRVLLRWRLAQIKGMHIRMRIVGAPANYAVHPGQHWREYFPLNYVV